MGFLGHGLVSCLVEVELVSWSYPRKKWVFPVSSESQVATEPSWDWEGGWVFSQALPSSSCNSFHAEPSGTLWDIYRRRIITREASGIGLEHCCSPSMTKCSEWLSSFHTSRNMKEGAEWREVCYCAWLLQELLPAFHFKEMGTSHIMVTVSHRWNWKHWSV